jgi:hypothetical protein
MTNKAEAAEVRRLLLEAGRLAEHSGMPPEIFAGAFMDALKDLMIEQARRDQTRPRPPAT